MEFLPFPKMARLSRQIVITEKIDGTNAAIAIEPVSVSPVEDLPDATAVVDGMVIYAQSRSRIIKPGDDNFGFAAWVKANAHDLVTLGAGTHFGEWWGSGIQRGYGLSKGEKRFSLFNVHRWGETRPACCHVVPTLVTGGFDTNLAEIAISMLKVEGSRAAPGFMKPEGIVVFHTAANLCFKKTIEKDEVPKALAEAA